MPKITKEMIDAGARALTDCDLLNDSYADIAEYVFEAMQAKRFQNEPPPPSDEMGMTRADPWFCFPWNLPR